MTLSRFFKRRTLFFLSSFLLLCVVQAEDVSHKLAIGATYVGGQIHWGFAERWALEARALKGEEDSDATVGTVTAYAYGVRVYNYFRLPKRTRLYWGLEGASTRSYSSSYDYKTDGFAFGGFGGAEIYLLRRFSVGLDMGPYVISSKVRGSDTSSGEMSVVINTYMNFYLL